MSWIIIAWSMMAAVSMTLGLVHLLIWLRHRSDYAHLWFSIVAASASLMAVLELQMMEATSVESYLGALRWGQLTVFALSVSLACLVHVYFRTGRLWLGALACGLRLVSLVINGLLEPGVVYRGTVQLEHLTVLGSETVTVAQGSIQPWLHLGQLSSLLLLIYVVDASISLWRRGSTDERRRAAFIGGSIAFTVAMAAGHAALLHAGYIRSPYMISTAFLAVVVAMGYELGSNVITAAETASQLRESELRMELAAGVANLGIWGWTAVHNGFWASPEGRALFGFSRDEALTFERFIGVIHADDQTKVRQLLQRALKEDWRFADEFRVVLADGATRWITTRGGAITAGNAKSGVLGVSVDVTARKQTELALRESEARFRSMADNAPVMIWMSGPDMDCIFFNKVWLDFTGRTLAQEIGNGWAAVVHPDELERCVGTYTKAFNARCEFDMEFRLRRHDGQYCWVHNKGVPRLANDGALLGYIGTCNDITERKETEELLRHAVEGFPSAVVMVNEFHSIVLANAQCEKLFGYAPGELNGQPIEMLIPPRLRETHKAHSTRFFAMPTARAMTPDGKSRELLAVRKDAGEFMVEINLNPIQTRGGCLVVTAINDITERKRAQSDLEKEKFFLRQVLDINPNFIFAKDRAGRFTLVNKAVADTYGTTVEDLVGKTDADFNPNPEEVEHFHRIDLEVLNTLKENFVAEEQITDADGKVRWLQTVKRPIFDDNGVATQVLGASTDITLRKIAEADAQANRNELAHVTRVSTMGELAASLAHELNQPLTAILSNVQAAQRFMAANTVDLNEVREILRDVVDDNNRASEVISRMRALVRKGQLEVTSLELDEVIRGVMLLVHSDAIVRGVRIELQLDGAPLVVRADKIQLQQVLLNLFLNAFDAIRSRPLKDRTVVVTTGIIDGAIARISVRDRGTGLTGDKLDSIFKPFFTSKRDGLGLGLSISRSIIESHGGRLWAENNTDQGATFYFTLPVVNVNILCAAKEQA